jgi:flagellar basal-body rod modification protein FlgD
MDVGATSGTTTQQSQTARTTLSGNYDTFLKLLTTQLQNQDPLEPMDSTKFTEQLVSYSQVEQQIATNENLNSLIALSKSAAGANAVTYLGKMAITEGDLSSLEGDAANWRYALGSDAANVQLNILNANGQIVRTLDGEKTVGAHDFTWDGKNASGTDLPDGTYRLVVTAKKADGSAVTSAVVGLGLVKEIDMSTAEPTLTVGTRNVKLTDIVGMKS